MEAKKFSDLSEFIDESVRFIEDSCKDKINTISIALSGGSTPKPVYQKLPESEKIPFNRIEFYQVDERYVPHDNPESNYKMIFESLIKKVKNDLKDFHYYDTSLPIDEALTKYSKEIDDIKFDLTILGMGTDGHIASLFPGSDALNENEKNTVHAETQKHNIKDRLTITIPVIKRSRKILMLLKGREKSQILKELQHSEKTKNELPAKALTTHNDFNVYYLTT
jgi:6-phosphogluconolactonase